MLGRSSIYLLLAVIGTGCGGGGGEAAKKAATPENQNQRPTTDKQVDVPKEEKTPPRPVKPVASKAADFYQKAMPATGYQPLPGEDPRHTSWSLRFGTDAGDVIMVQVSSKDGQTTQVHIHGISAAVLAAVKKRDDGTKPSKN
jgi:hypothetical protein